MTQKDDLISRQAAIDAVEILLEQTEEDADVKTWNNAIRGSINAVKHHVPSAEPEKRTNKRTETHECDLISRQDVLKIIRNHIKETDSEYVKSVLVNLAECVKDTRSAERTGRWIVYEPQGVWTNIYHCSECGGGVMSCKVDLPKFCGHCGVKMEV